ncbi:hypothetical protein ACOI1C_02475 [Bacillus sp. DJP31]|uniref:hypothetical protein n=1 Tax=Bacillus sp. DJP31 TaxID=3409789 RepID=UPI003BB71DE0
MNLKMKRMIYIAVIFLLTITLTKLLYPQEVRESLTYFPIDPSLSFLTAETILTLQTEKGNDEHFVDWETISETDKKVYLRQDVSILFRGGFLVDSMYQWKENASTLEQLKNVRGEESSLFQSISLHHAEIHLQDDVIKSAQTMTMKNLYIIDSSFSPLDSFQKPSNKEQSEWKKIVDHVLTEHLNYSWNELISYFQINRENYYEITMLDLITYNSKPLPGFDQGKSQEIIGQLWEGLYKNYLLGIKLSPSETISPIGSKVPLILLSKDLTHLYILIEGKDGEKIKLVQEL